MTSYRIITPYLDECGFVYVAACGLNGSCVRLNRRGSEIWRQVATGGGLPADHPDADERFVTHLLQSGAIASEATDA